MGNRKPSLNESDRLWLFCFRLAELQATRYYREFKAIQMRPIDGAVVLPAIDEELFVSFLTSYRLFHQKSEPTYMGGGGPHGISDIIREVLSGTPKLSSRVKAIDDEFAARGTFLYRILGDDNKPLKDLDEEGIFHLWMDTRYFHSDAEGLQFFYQLRPETIEECRRAFQLLLLPRVRRLIAYFPLAKHILEHGLLTKGCGSITFHAKEYAAAGGADTRTGTITVPKKHVL